MTRAARVKAGRLYHTDRSVPKREIHNAKIGRRCSGRRRQKLSRPGELAILRALVAVLRVRGERGQGRAANLTTDVMFN